MKLEQKRVFPFSFNEERNTVDVIFSSGERVYREGLKPYWEELEISNEAVDFQRLNNGAPILKNHNQSLESVIGVVENGRIENNLAIATIRFSNREDVKTIVQDIKDGILRSVSVGYRIEKFEKVGELNDVPIFRATKWLPAEISIVSIPADINAQIRSLNEEQNMNENEKENEKEDKEDNVTKERERIFEITKLVRSLGLDTFGDTLIKDGTQLDQARALILNEVVKNQPKVTNTTTLVDSGEKFRNGISEAIEIRAGYVNSNKENEFRGMTLSEMAKRSLVLNGHSDRGDKMDVIGRAFLSTSDFPAILSNVANKYLKKGYEESPETWQAWTTIVSVSDFKPQTFVAMSEFGLLDQVNEHQEYKNASMSDGKETITINTFGKIVSLTRASIINDDTSAFTRIPEGLGKAAKRTVNKSVYDKLFSNPAMLTDSTAVFHANHNNILTGVISGGISVAILDSIRSAMAKQMDLSKSAYLNLMPSILLVPVGLSGVAKVIIQSQYDPDATNKLQRANAAFNMVESIVADPLLDANSASAFYCISKQYDSVMVGFLDGNQTPTLETQTGWTVDGVETKVRLDWGVGIIDYRPLFKHTGA